MMSPDTIAETDIHRETGVSAAMSKAQFEDLQDNPRVVILDEHKIGSHAKFDVFVSYAHSVPRRASGKDENPVECPNAECGSTWEKTTLYRTGDVLRCPKCDAVMRP